MAFWHITTGRKRTGGKISRHRKKMKMDRGSEPALTKLGKYKAKARKVRGNQSKFVALSAEYANLFIGSQKPVKAKILSVERNSANPNYARRNIITKGSIIKTEKGSARVTSRPGQDGLVNAVLLK